VSRLDSFIRRLEAQRACLDWAAQQVAARPGIVLELGLGNGRTYDHLRDRLPDHPILAFDRQLAAHPGCIPPAEHLLLGDFRETLPPLAGQLTLPVVLVHADTGSGDTEATAALAAWLGPALVPVLSPGALVLSDQRLTIPGATLLPLPPKVPPGRYFIYRAGRSA